MMIKLIPIIMILTAYCPCKICCGSNSPEARGHGLTRWLGLRPLEGITAACPPDMKQKDVIIPGLGLRHCEDTGSAVQRKGKTVHIDIFFDNHKSAIEFGKKKVIGYEVRMEM